MKKIRILLLLSLYSVAVMAQDKDLDALTLNDLLDMKVGVASLKELSAKESPGIITIITRDDIEQSGAHDLMDILETVPGMDFGVDVEGVVGLGVRGNWAHEGKVLLMYDGQVMNEGLYSSIQLGNHYPVENIKKIEIIRGPGSAIYGDYAEYAVINIITEQGSDLNGVEVGAIGGTMRESVSQAGMYFAGGMQHKKLGFDIKASYLEGNRSDFTYQDVYGIKRDLTGNSKLNNSFFNAGINYMGFSFRAMTDFYHTTSLDEYQSLRPDPVRHTFDNYYTELSYSGKISSKVTMLSRAAFKRQAPWRALDIYGDTHTPFLRVNERATGSFVLQYDPLNDLNVTAGFEAYHDYSFDEDQVEPFAYSGNNSFEYYNAALYAQLLWRNKLVTITAGARQNFNSEFASAFVPRLGITRAIGKFYFKGLYTESYRAPSVMNIDFGMDIKPEYTRVGEVEAGYSINHNLYISLNGYIIETKDPIIYYYDEVNDADAYINHYKTGTEGFESQLKYKGKYLSVNAAYSFYTSQQLPSINTYEVPDNAGALLAFPQHKSFIELISPRNKLLQAYLRLVYTGKRYGINAIENDEDVYASYDPYVKMNVFVRSEDIGGSGISAGAGINNITDIREVYIQPYNSGHAPLPGRGREFRVELSYRWNKMRKEGK